MYPSKDARELAILLRISRELDIVGDVSATVDNPSELLAWATILTRPDVAAWRAKDSDHRYLQVTAEHHRAPVRGRVTAVLAGEQHLEFWHALDLDGLEPGGTRCPQHSRPFCGLGPDAGHASRPEGCRAGPSRCRRAQPKGGLTPPTCGCSSVQWSSQSRHKLPIEDWRQPQGPRH